PAVATPFPYTTLFRSVLPAALRLRLELRPGVRAGEPALLLDRGAADGLGIHPQDLPRRRCHRPGHRPAAALGRLGLHDPGVLGRSEEHTSELQSRENL